MEEDRKKSPRQIAVLALVIAIVIIMTVVIWEFVLRGYFTSTEGGPEYKIDIWQGDQKIGQIGMSELQDLPTVSYVDTLGSGEIDEGPLLRDVILLRFDESSLTNETTVFIRSDLRGEERTISWGEVSNISKSHILDFTNKGTTKFTSPETERNERVRDITLIRIGA